MKHVGAFGRFWWDFVVGDDWTVAAGVAVGLVLAAILVDADNDAWWWILPVVVALVLAGSLWREARRHSASEGEG